MDRRLIEHFVNANLLSRQDMQRLILRASKEKTGIVSQILDAGVIDDEALADQIAAFYQYDPLDSGAFFMDTSALGFVAMETAMQAGALPYGFEPGTARVYVAVYEPELAREAISQVEKGSGQPAVIRIAPRGWLLKAIPFYYQQGNAEGRSDGGRAQNSWAQRPRSSGRVTPGDFGHGDQPASGVHRLSPRGAGTGRPGIQSRSTSSPNSFNDFDDLLREEEPSLSPRASVIGRPRLARRPDDSGFGDLSGAGSLWEPEQVAVANTSRAPWDAPMAPPSLPPRAGTSQEMPLHDSGFSLFDTPEPQQRHDMTLQEIAELHHQKIKGLKEEAQRQREVIQALADLLIEARVISRRDLTAKLQSLRKK